MFELSFIKKYLTPKRKQLSVSLIALLSVAMITLVVWLVVVFLSVTEGIEKNWIQKLTALNAPLRIQPTSEYYSSYYYNVDRYSSASNYLSKTIGEKARTLISDPYDPDFDESLPPAVHQPDKNQDGTLLDPVKSLTKALNALEDSVPGLVFQDVEMSGALLRLDLYRQDRVNSSAEVKSQLTNVSFLASFPEKNPTLKDLILEPTEEDLNHLLFLSNRLEKKRQEAVLQNATIQELETSSDLWKIPIDLIPDKASFSVNAYQHRGDISHILIPTNGEGASKIEKRNGRIFFMGADGIEIPVDLEIPIFSHGKMTFSVDSSSDMSFEVKTNLQENALFGKVGLEGLAVKNAKFALKNDVISPLWPFLNEENVLVLPKTENETGILIAKNFKENGVRIGDAGYLAYSAPSISGAKEVQLPVYVCGFYDPGIMAVGNKCVLVPPEITQAINGSDSAFTLEKSEANQIFVWFPKIGDAKKIKEALLEKLHASGIDKYWKVETFQEYEFAKDLMQQFQSDKYLFAMVGILILLVACTNIISLLVLLVSDKKKEIGILRAMGAKKRSIASIFALSGAFLGVFSCLLGVFLAFLTMKNIDHLVGLLSLLQGHEAFNAQFFGNSLPHDISPKALLFATIITPLLALVAGLFPAIKASRLKPVDTLRSE